MNAGLTKFFTLLDENVTKYGEQINGQDRYLPDGRSGIMLTHAEWREVLAGFRHMANRVHEVDDLISQLVKLREHQ